jgi:hypothetical protein
METSLFLWRSVPRPCKKAIVTALKTKKQLWTFKAFRKTSLPILRFIKRNPQVEKFIQSELTGSLVTSVLGDDPFLYTQYGISFHVLAVRLLFQSIVRDMYITRLVESIIHLQHVHTVLPFLLTLVHVVVKG